MIYLFIKFKLILNIYIYFYFIFRYSILFIKNINFWYDYIYYLFILILNIYIYFYLYEFNFFNRIISNYIILLSFLNFIFLKITLIIENYYKIIFFNYLLNYIKKYKFNLINL